MRQGIEFLIKCLKHIWFSYWEMFTYLNMQINFMTLHKDTEKNHNTTFI